MIAAIYARRYSARINRSALARSSRAAWIGSRLDTSCAASSRASRCAKRISASMISMARSLRRSSPETRSQTETARSRGSITPTMTRSSVVVNAHTTRQRPGERPMRRRLFPTMCLLLWATTAHAAECAWVLWAEVVRAGKIWGSTTEYVLVSGYSTQANCLAAVNSKSGEVARAGVVTQKICPPRHRGPARAEREVAAPEVARSGAVVAWSGCPPRQSAPS